MLQLTDTLILNRQSSRSAAGRRREAAPRTWWAYPLCISIGVISLFILTLCQGARLVGSQHRLTQLKASKAALEKDQMTLHLRIEKLSSLERIERVAVGRLGMQQPAGREVLDLTPLDRKTAALRMEVASGRLDFSSP